MTAPWWLSSYPKSGNTWFRMLLATLEAGGGPIDINDPPDRDGIASARGLFESMTLLDTSLLTADEIDDLRPAVYRAWAAFEGDGHERARPRFVKVHDAYLATSRGEPLLGGAAAAAGAIVIVRDPRAVAPSLAHHLRLSVDEAISMMNDRDAALSSGLRGQTRQLRQRLLDWSGHVASWLGQGDIPVHLVRYEDLSTQPVAAFGAALAFAGVSVSDEVLARAVDYSSFSRLQAQEREKGFLEWQHSGRAGLFFRRGTCDGWKGELSDGQIRRIEMAHGPMMARLGYRKMEEGNG
ncbi:MAG: sulfotransferase domain-containing protein [Telmatospirillum sp.]|nr:sulfotransferase domain-containing protein [Telmatospirillum sp.]